MSECFCVCCVLNQIVLFFGLEIMDKAKGYVAAVDMEHDIGFEVPE